MRSQCLDPNPFSMLRIGHQSANSMAGIPQTARSADAICSVRSTSILAVPCGQGPVIRGQPGERVKIDRFVTFRVAEQKDYIGAIGGH
jgi:hypothetical protein